MGTALFSAVSGLIAQQQKMDVIAANIANANTTGYRGARVLFRDLFSQTLEGSRAPLADFGGTNPSQVGLGVRLASIDVDYNQGSLQTTGVNSDLAIQGAGFFVLRRGQDLLFTRDGSFALNSEGTLIDPSTGLNVQGLPADSNGVIDVNAVPGDLTVPLGGVAIVQATSRADLVGNLDSTATVGDVVQRSIRVVDSLGSERDVQITYTKRTQVDDGSGTLFNAWEWTAEYNGNNALFDPTGTAVSGVLLFNPDGSLASEGVIDAVDAYTARPAGDPSVTIDAADLGNPPTLPQIPFEFTIDFTGVTELSAASDTTMSYQDGFTRGVLESFNIGGDGVINGVFTNGLTQVLGQVVLANFSNYQGLDRAGNNMFRQTPASGSPQIGLPSDGGRGSVTGGVLEGSNVDLGTEFSNMIITQRAFQANSRTITTADTMLQETVNLVR